MAIVENEGQSLQDRDYRQHLNRNWDAINQYEKNVNTQIEQVLSNPPASSADEVTQLRIDTQGNEYPLAKPRVDDVERIARSVANQLPDKADTSYVESLINQLIPGTPQGAYASLIDLQNAYPSGTAGIYITTDNGHYYYYNGGWKDGGAYQAKEIAKQSIDWSMIKQPLTRATIILGNVTIDSRGGIITTSEDLALDVNFNFIYPGKSSSLAIPKTNDPLYYSINRTQLTFSLLPVTEAKKMTNDEVLIGILYGGVFYTSGDHANEHINYIGQKYRPERNTGEIVYGDFNIDHTNNLIRTTTKQTIFSCNGQLKTSNTALSVEIPVDTDQFIVFVYYDFLNDKLVCVNSADFLNTNLWYLFALYKDEIFDTDSNHFTFIDRTRLSDRDSETSVILFNDNYKINIKEENEQGIINIPAGTCFYINANGHYLRVPSEFNLEYTNRQSDVNINGLLTFYYDLSEKTVYSAYFKRKYDDVKLFSIYGGKIYGANQKGFIVNGIEDGGWLKVKKPKRDLMDWYQLATSSGKANIAWLGDSTWEGYRVKNPNNIFPVYLNSLLPNEFSGVKSFNCSKGGYSTKQLYDNYDVLTANASDLGILMIGGGLNDGYDLSGLTESEKYLDLIVQKAYEKGLTPVIVTTQATALLYASKATGGDWNKQQAGFNLINKMKRRYAERNNVDLLDLEKYTQDFIEKSPMLMADMFSDYLHGQDPIHIFEANLAMAYLTQHCDFINDNQLIGITTMNARSDVPYNKAYQPLAKIEDGFKVKFNYTANAAEKLLDYQFFIPVDGHQWQLDGFNNGNTIKIMVNGKDHDLTADSKVCDLPAGYYHIIVKSTAGGVDFKGLKVTHV